MRLVLLCCFTLVLQAADEAPPTTGTAPDLPTAATVPDDAAMAPVLAEELPVYDTSGWPESPSTVSGERIWEPPRFTVWPAVVYEDERRHIAVSFPLRAAGTVSMGWSGEDPAEVEIPLRLIGKQHSGLLWLPQDYGRFTAAVAVPISGASELPVRIVGLADDWPHDHLAGGMPVDADGVPVVVRMPRWQPDRDRRLAIFAKETPRPTGEPILIGDPLAALGEDSWAGIAATQIPCLDDRFPQHAVLPVLAGLTAAAPWPRTIVWSPGNNSLAEQTWNGEDERILSLIRLRAAAMGHRPRMVLVLPPLPMEQRLRETAERRRDALLRTALFLGWEAIDAARICGAPEQANRLAEGVYARYPIGPARERLRAALAETLAID